MYYRLQGLQSNAIYIQMIISRTKTMLLKTKIVENETSLFKLHSLLHKLKAIDFALHTSHIENLLWNVLECQKTMLETEPRVCSNIWGAEQELSNLL